MAIFAEIIWDDIAAFTMFSAVKFSAPQLSIILLCTLIPNAFAIGLATMKTMITMFFFSIDDQPFNDINEFSYHSIIKIFIKVSL